jgi:hypothetical protein
MSLPISFWLGKTVTFLSDAGERLEGQVIAVEPFHWEALVRVGGREHRLPIPALSAHFEIVRSETNA